MGVTQFIGVGRIASLARCETQEESIRKLQDCVDEKDHELAVLRENLQTTLVEDTGPELCLVGPVEVGI